MFDVPVSLRNLVDLSPQIKKLYMDEQEISCFLSLKNCRALFTALRDCSHSFKSLTSIICLLPLVSANKNKTSYNETKPFMKSLQHLFPYSHQQVLTKALGILDILLLLGAEPHIQILILYSTQPGKLSNQITVAYQFTSHQL